jgi:hypothetical protein
MSLTWILTAIVLSKLLMTRIPVSLRVVRPYRKTMKNLMKMIVTITLQGALDEENSRVTVIC